MDLKTFTNKKDWTEATLRFFEEVVQGEGVKNIALSGGNTPRPAYEALAGHDDIDFSKINLYQIDERYTNNESKYSNYKMINESLVQPLGDKLGSFHFFDTSIGIENSLKKYESELEKVPPFDLAIMGIGEDGHTASLFPHSQALQETEKLVTHTHSDKYTNPDRLTLTFPAIMPSKRLLLLAIGENKEGALEKLQKPDAATEEFPAKKLLEHPDLTIHFGDF